MTIVPQPQKLEDYSRVTLRGDVETFLEKRIEYTGDNPIYIGWTKTPNAATSQESFFIVKLTYSGDNPTRIQLPDDGAQFKYAWDDRASLFA